MSVFEDTVKNLLRMKPKPHKPAKGENGKADDQPKRTGRRPGSEEEGD